jgi:transposase-like protein
VHVRTCQYLNNIVEQDHRAIKRRCAPMLGFKSVKTAVVTISGIELAHRIRKRQFICQPTDRRETLNLRTAWFAAVMV